MNEYWAGIGSGLGIGVVLAGVVVAAARKIAENVALHQQFFAPFAPPVNSEYGLGDLCVVRGRQWMTFITNCN